MSRRLLFSDVWNNVDRDTLLAVAEHLLEAGHTREVVINDLATAIDAMLPFGVLVPGLAGAALEAADGPLLHLAARLIVKAAERAIAKRQAALPQPG